MTHTQFSYRPIDHDTYPTDGKSTYKSCRFRTKLSATLTQLDHELRRMGVDRAVIELDMPEHAIRRDGLPRSDARRPATPRVRLSFIHPDPAIGPLQYPCDTFDRHEANIRAIVLTMEAQRAMDRYGATRCHQQYAGWKQLPAGASETMDVTAAAEFIAANNLGATDSRAILNSPTAARVAYRSAAKQLHPDTGDTGGDAELFATLMKAKRTMDIYHNGSGVRL